MTKQSEAAKTYFIGHDLDRSKGGTPLWVGWTKEFRTLSNKMILLDMRG